MIERESKRLIQLIGDSLRLSQIEGTQEQRPALEPVELFACIRRTASLLEESARQKQVELHVEGEALSVPGNANYLSELVLNLMDNAVKYNRPGGSVRVSLRRTEHHAVLEVCDTGIGIPQESQPRVFERFYRVDKSRSKEIGGTGLGLSIVKHIVEFHHGTLSLESEEGKGTRMTVELPL
jgi:two-component system phosphate regulon sensor histidine kinase PhoR